MSTRHFSRSGHLFRLGSIVTTPGVLYTCTTDQLLACVTRHADGDWGVVCPEDSDSNTAAVRDGSRILSAYPINPSLPCQGHGDNTIWVITEADRSVTTVLLPEEY